ncbi:MAG: hypothetical protein ACK5H1_08560 [Tenacibaculum sp.]
MRQKCRKFSLPFKARVVVEALKEQSTLSDLSKRFEVPSKKSIVENKHYL